jgi:probable F420-dependent oxidoreductase
VTLLSLNVPNFGPETDASSLLEWARFAEDAGFTTLVVSDHVVPTREITELYPDPFYDSFTLLAWLAGQTRRIRLGISVLIVPYRHPLLTARMSAALHDLSGGRFVLGAGAGWSASEFAAVGQDFGARGATTDRYLQLITQAWSRERVSYRDGAMQFEAATGPRPVSRPIPLWIGGAGPAARRRAVELGSAWHPANPELDWLREVGLPDLACKADEAASEVPAFVPRIKAQVSAEPASGPRRPLGVGTVNQIVRDVCALAELGAAEVVLDPNPDRPRPRDFVVEQQHLRDIRDTYVAENGPTLASGK